LQTLDPVYFCESEGSPVPKGSEILGATAEELRRRYGTAEVESVPGPS
jgi:hypothetical protein